MLTIRLRRAGAKKDPHYRVVVAEDSSRRDGPFLEVIGHYHPRREPAEVVFDLERTEAWLARGARMSDTVRSLYRRVRSGRLTTVAQAEAPVQEDEPAEEAAADAAEAGRSETTEAVTTEAAGSEQTGSEADDAPQDPAGEAGEEPAEQEATGA